MGASHGGAGEYSDSQREQVNQGPESILQERTRLPIVATSAFASTTYVLDCIIVLPLIVFTP